MWIKYVFNMNMYHFVVWLEMAAAHEAARKITQWLWLYTHAVSDQINAEVQQSEKICQVLK